LVLTGGYFFLPLFFPGYDASFHSLMYRSLWILAPFPFLISLGVLCKAQLDAAGKYLYGTLTPAITVCVLLVFITMTSPQLGVLCLPIAILIGASVEGTCLGYFSSIKWKGGLSKPLQRDLLKAFAPIMGASLFMGSTIFVDQYMASLTGSGNITALNYGYRLVMFFATFAVTCLITVLYPHFSRCISQGNIPLLKKHCTLFSVLVCLSSIPLCIGLYMFSEDSIRILFGRGAFSEEDVFLVSRIQVCLVPLIPFYILSVMYTRILAALNKNRFVLYVSIANLIVNIVCNYVGMYYFGVVGIAVSTSVVYLLSSGVLWLFLNSFFSASHD
ncbi:MAG: polysaccharide biosynthesis C-terminal domain-containing protein, partial [Planctomycetes bacterium]|nr:polysaccharide biosynthesis C-terminal domain-containing protein [Planctomycetota bacterium]